MTNPFVGMPLSVWLALAEGWSLVAFISYLIVEDYRAKP